MATCNSPRPSNGACAGVWRLRIADSGMPPASGAGSPTASSTFTTTTANAIAPTTSSVTVTARRLDIAERLGGRVFDRAVEARRLAHGVGRMVRLAARGEPAGAHVVGEAFDRARGIALQ